MSTRHTSGRRSKAVLAGGEPPEVTPILADDAALRDVELLHTAADSMRCGDPDMPHTVKLDLPLCGWSGASAGDEQMTWIVLIGP